MEAALTIRATKTPKTNNVHSLHIFADDGGLISYGPDAVDQVRQAASYDAPMSAFGTKRTSLFAPHMSAIGGKADILVCTAHVRF